VTDDSNRHQLRSLVSACLALAILTAWLLGPVKPAPASARVSPASGGAGVTGVLAPGATSVLPVSGLRSVSGGGITLDSPPTALLKGTVSFTGTVSQAKEGETIVIQRHGSLPGEWVQAASATVGAGGEFAASWHVNESGSLSVRAVLDSAATNIATARAAALAPRRAAARAAALAPRRAAAQALTFAATPALTLTVYRGAVATIFGPGLFGRRTACGERLEPATIGVASRTLPCGSMVAIYYKGHQLVVPVIDRGPYARHVGWDLTSATATALGMTETARIGALSPPPAA
jgi:rare lipoprotein A